MERLGVGKLGEDLGLGKLVEHPRLGNIVLEEVEDRAVLGAVGRRMGYLEVAS